MSFLPSSKLWYSHPGVPLKEHLLKVRQIIEELTESSVFSQEIKELASLTAIGHDLGKANDYFQRYLIGEGQSPSHLSEHSLLSAVLTIWHLASHLPVEKQIPIFLAIRYHHSNIYSDELFYPKFKWEYLSQQAKTISFEDFKNFIKELGYKTERKELLPDFRKFARFFTYRIDLEEKGGIELYMLTNLLLGLLVEADRRAVIDVPPSARYYFPPDIVELYLNALITSRDIDSLRAEFYSTVIDNLNRNIDAPMFSITAPTGIGKTFTGLSAAFRIRDHIFKKEGRLPRIIYVLPFISIVDQTANRVRKLLKFMDLPEELLLVHHFKVQPEDDIGVEEYQRWSLKLSSWDSEIIITTFVRLFSTLFTNLRSEMKRLHRLAGSVLILDEVQNIPVKYWEIMERVLKFLSDRWGTRIILMTATKPALLPEAVELTGEKKRFFFQNLSRTRIINIKQTYPYKDIEEWLIPNIEGSKNFMVVVNTVKTAQEIYQQLKTVLKDYKLYYLAASLIPKVRLQRIKEVKEALDRDERLGLVSTQVIEAGIDIDFSRVIRDIAPIDSIVQVSGRCNRNNEMEQEGLAYLVRLKLEDKERLIATFVYDSVLLDVSERHLKEDEYPEYQYLDLTETYFHALRELVSQNQEVMKWIKALNYSEIGRFTLIEDFYELPVLIEYDEEATRLIQWLEEVLEERPANYEERIKRRNLIDRIFRRLSEYIINVPRNIVAEYGLPLTPFSNTLIWLPANHPLFEHLYDEEIGFKRTIQQKGVFL